MSIPFPKSRKSNGKRVHFDNVKSIISGTRRESIRERRIRVCVELGMTQRDFGRLVHDRTGISPETYGGKENGHLQFGTKLAAVVEELLDELEKKVEGLHQRETQTKELVTGACDYFDSLAGSARIDGHRIDSNYSMHCVSGSDPVTEILYRIVKDLVLRAVSDLKKDGVLS